MSTLTTDQREVLVGAIQAVLWDRAISDDDSWRDARTILEAVEPVVVQIRDEAWPGVSTRHPTHSSSTTDRTNHRGTP